VTADKKVPFISESEGSYLDVVTTAYRPIVRIVYNKQLKETKNLPDNMVNIADFIDVKGLKAQGNQLTKLKVKEIVIEPQEVEQIWPEEIQEQLEVEVENEIEHDNEVDGTTVEWDFTQSEEDEDQMTLF
jgi:topoisomerase-4 subunit A